MFDKIGDIVYEPVKLVCDAFRQPLKQIDNHNKKKNAEHAQKLEKQLKQFEADLEYDKKRREMELTIEQRKREEDINQMILDNDLARREKMVNLEMKYRQEMAAAAKKMADGMSKITEETRNRIMSLYAVKTIEYLDIQKKFEEHMYSNADKLIKLFPGEKGEEKIMDTAAGFKRCGFACSVVPDKAVNLSGQNMQGEVIDRFFLSVVFR